MKRQALIYIGGAVLILGVFTFFLKQTANAFNKPRAKNQEKIRLFKGRSNFGGVQNKGGYKNLAGNRSQRKRQNKSVRLMGRA